MLQYVDTRQGTNNAHSYSNGNTLPYTTVPFGMNHYVVQTNHEGSWFFNPNHRVFQGIRVSHQPSPWMGDFASFLMTPIAGFHMKGDIFSYQSSYRPEEAVYQPHYLKIKQARYNITTELTATERGGQMRMTYATKEQPGFILNAKGNSWYKLDSETSTLTGFINNFSGCLDEKFGIYFTLTFDHKIDLSQTGYFSENEFLTASEMTGADQHFIIRFLDATEKTVSANFSTSYISIEQAELNFSRENQLGFNEMKEQAANRWNHYLTKIIVTDSDTEKVKTFYTCLYRMFLFPQKFYELDENNEPIHYNTTAKKVDKGILYTNNGFWDTYRTVYPLYSLIAPDEYREMLEGFLTSYHEAGYLPKWLSPDERGMMPGTLIDAVIADAAVKGVISREMTESLLEAMLKAATKQSTSSIYGRQGTADYLKYGYVPTTHHESVNHTQDYAYSDYCISQVADVLGKKELANTYRKSALNYRNIFDAKTGFMRGKDVEGNFRSEFNLLDWGLDYTEGSAWQNSFAVYQDFQGLINEYGSKEAFTKKITELCNTEPRFDVLGYGFEIHEMSEMAAVDYGQVAISNQPSFHIPYLFNYAGEPASTQVVVKQIMSRLFNSGFDGYPGDEDNGSMAGWFVFSSMGFYPVTPGSGEYVRGIPLFDSVEIQLANGKKVSITTENNNPQSNFVADFKLNQSEYQKLFITHDDLMAGATLDIRLGLAPVYREYSKDELPFSIQK
ncbi:GH92 family glycosyl hydrolase [Carnobacterium maltaromaticum]|uniref:GH92 family glycosyl hydrolase n=1 Tax=Carnobacterium maltaromaticum TaxID=2751 RepID=UPI0039BE229F